MNSSLAAARERLEQNEIVIRDLLNKIQEYQNENQRYKEYCNQLEDRISILESQNKCLNDDINGKKKAKNFNDHDDQSISVLPETYVDIGTVELCAKIEQYLNETNENLKKNLNFKDSIELLVINLLDLILIQYSSKDVYRLRDIKTSLILKFDQIQACLSKYNEINSKYAKLQNDYERLKCEFDAYKTGVISKSFVDDGQAELLSIEFIKCKEEMERVQDKVIEQNTIIQKLVDKLESFIEIKSISDSTILSRNNRSALASNESTVEILNTKSDTSDSDKSNTPSPTTSVTGGFINSFRRTLDSMSSPFVTIDQNTLQEQIQPRRASNEPSPPIQPQSQPQPQPRLIRNIPVDVKRNEAETNYSLNVYQCPKCYLQITNEIEFELFQEHVKGCDNTKLSCMFCLKLFDQNEKDLYIDHVMNSHEYN